MRPKTQEQSTIPKQNKSAVDDNPDEFLTVRQISSSVSDQIIPAGAKLQNPVQPVEATEPSELRWKAIAKFKTYQLQQASMLSLSDTESGNLRHKPTNLIFTHFPVKCCLIITQIIYKYFGLYTKNHYNPTIFATSLPICPS